MLKNKSDDGSEDSWDENGNDERNNLSEDEMDIEISIASNFDSNK